MFPNPVTPPPDVYLARIARNNHVVRSASWGIALRFSIIVFELIGVATLGSSALLMDALASTADIVFSLSLIISIKLADRPPDENHPFGHGRYEPLIGMQLGLLLALIGCITFFQQLFNITHVPEQPIAISPWAWIFALIAVVILEISYRVVMLAAKKHDSPALAGDALHYRIDSVTSLLAMITLIAAAFIPAWSQIIDHLGALLISALMVGIGLYAAKINLNQLMDVVPDAKFFAKVKEAAMNVTGVLGTEKIRIQSYGPDAHVDIDVEVKPELTVKVAHGISQKVRVEIQKAWPAVRDVTVHIEPYYPDDH